MNRYRNKTVWLIFLAIFAGIIFFWKKDILTGINNLPDGSKIPGFEKIQPTPTVFKFQELTIPYLRKRKYFSKTGELNKNYENSEYTAYLTNYESDGFKVNALLTKPAGRAPEGGWPAIIFIHGYIPPMQYNTLQNYYSYVDYLARKGFVVFKIDLRGNGNSEGEPGGAYYSADYIIDTLNAYSALQNTDFVNSTKIGLWGHSMAGNIVMRSFAVKPDIPAVVIWAGAVYSYTDQQLYGINDSSYRPPGLSTERQRRRQEIRNLYGEPKADNFFWQQMAPVNYLKDLKGAVQIHHALDDAVVNIGYSRDLIKLLDNTSVIHRLYEYQSGGHNLSGAAFNQAMQRTVDFFNNNL